LLLVASSARADGEHEHDGLMLRFSPGHGATWIRDYRAGTTSATSTTVELGHGLGIDIGFALLDGLSIHGRWSLMFATTEGQYTSADLLGAGITYYFAEPNVFVSAVAGIAYDGARNAGGVREPDDGPAFRPSRLPDHRRVAADPGIGVDLDVGKEFWVSDNWGLGPALRLGLRQLDHEGPGGPSLISILAVFSATYQ
jgi:hypothetical protein